MAHHSRWRIVAALAAAGLLISALFINHLIARCRDEGAIFRVSPWGCQPALPIHIERGIQRT